MTADDIEITHRFAGAARAFCNLLDGLEGQDRASFLGLVACNVAKLIEIAARLPSVEPRNEGREPPEETQDVSLRVSELLGDWDLHRQVFNPVALQEDDDCEVVTMTLSDDLGDIYRDLREGLHPYDHGHLRDAAWDWRFLFFAHWGRHATSALRAIVWRLDGLHPQPVHQSADASQRWFGDPGPDHGLRPEPARGPADAHEVESIFEGYRALDAATERRYGNFLLQAARCRTCSKDDKIPSKKQPIPFLCGRAGLDDTTPESFERAHKNLANYRRLDETAVPGSIRVAINSEIGLGELATFLDEHGLAGLSIGHCGWGDLTSRLRGDQLGEGVDVMILGADWYPLTQCSNFLLDRYSVWDDTLRNFFGRLGVGRQAVAAFFQRNRVYLGNTLLCYRTGWDRKGESNLSPRSFENCLPHLKRHLDALSPRILVTFGRDAARSASKLLKGEAAEDEQALSALRADPKIGQVMEALYSRRPSQGIRALRDGAEIRFVPLYHPSMGNSNRYQGEYDALLELLDLG